MEFTAKTKILSTTRNVIEKNGKRFFFCTFFDEGADCKDSNTDDVYMDESWIPRFEELASLSPLTPVEMDVSLVGTFKTIRSLNVLGNGGQNKAKGLT